MAEVTGEDLRNRMVDVYPEGEPCFEPTGVAVQGVDDQPRNRFTSNEDIIISLNIVCFKTVPRLIVVLELTDADGYSLLLSDSGDDPAAGNDRVLLRAITNSAASSPSTRSVNAVFTSQFILVL